MSRYANQTTALIEGLPVPLAGVLVYVYDQTGALAALTEDGGGPLANPVTSDQYGNFHFNTADGLYALEYHYGGQRLYRDEAVQVGAGLPLPDSVLLALAQPSILDLLGGGGFWTTIEAQHGAGDGNPTTGTGTINNTAFNAALAVAQATGAKLYLTCKTYRLHDYTATLPNDGVPNVNGVPGQKPITIVGSGHHAAGEGSAPTGGSILMFTGSGTAPRWLTNGQGCLTLSDFSIISRESGAGRPFFQTSGTTIYADRLCVWTPKVKTACNDDPFVMGGNTVTPPYTGVTGAFQGYGLHINDCYFNGIRSLKVNAFGNAIVITNNTFWNNCGSNESHGGAIMVNGAATDAADQFDVGLTIEGNLIEAQGYYRPIYCRSMTEGYLAGNNIYDAAGFTECAVYLDSACTGNVVIRGLAPAGLAYLIDAASNAAGYPLNALFSGRQEEQTIIPSFKAGTPSSPCTIFGLNLTAIANVIAPTNGNTSAAHLAVNATTAGGNGLLSWSVLGTAAFVYGNQTGAGNITNPVTGAMNYSANGRTMTCDGAFTLDTGAGGSNSTQKAAAHIFTDHSGTEYARINSSGVVAKQLQVTNPTVPATAGAAGTAGTVAWDASYVYVCIATNTWKRAAIATW